MTCNRYRLFTLAEILVATGLVALLTATTVPFLYNTLQVSFANRMKSELTLEQYVCSEYLKRDLLSTSRDRIVVAPTNGVGIEAVSFPIIWRGRDVIAYPLDAEQEIAWTDTIVYHMFNNPETGMRELRRTRFNPRHSSLTTVQRQQQLNDVLANGTGRGTYNGTNATTDVLLKDVASYEIDVNPHEVDCYSPQRKRSVVTLGSAMLTPGVHKLKFEIVGNHPFSSGYGLGIDTVTASQSGNALEAEYFAASAIGTPKPVQINLSQEAGWSNHAVLDFPANSVGQSFVCEVHNDCWLESNFTAETATLENAEVSFEEELGESVVQQIGNEITWEARVQSNGGSPSASATPYADATIRVLIAGGDPIAGGCIFYNGQRGNVTFSNVLSNGSLTVERAFIMERDENFNGIAETVRELEFAEAETAAGVTVSADSAGFTLAPGSTIRSDRFDLPLDTEKDYLVSFHLSDVPEQAYLTEWPDAQGLAQSYVLQNDAEDLSGSAAWSVNGTAVQFLTSILAVESVFATYPESSTYTSRVFDTHLDDPEYIDIDWRLRLQGGAVAPLLRVRSGDQADLSDALPWANALLFSTVNNSSLMGLSPGRYVQFQIVFQGMPPYEQTAKVRDVMIRWHGESKGVELAAAIVKGPDRGKFRFYFDDGTTATSDLSFKFNIQKKFRHHQYVTSFSVDGKPRNK